MNVLIVDDDVVDRKIIRRAIGLTDEDDLLTEVSSVKEGLAALTAAHYDVILLDYRMPEMDGIQMMNELRSATNSSKAAVIMMSASENESLALECIEAGAQDFITKNDLTNKRLKKATLHAQKRFQLECKLHESYTRAKEMAEKDTLTGLSNRYSFEESLKVMISNNRMQKQSLALLMLDLDNFKWVNDSLGHGVGDRVLQKVVLQIQTCLRQNEVFARLGGDEFAILIGALETIHEINQIAQRIIKSVEVPFYIDGHEINASLSIGIALHPADASSGDDLLKKADIAMYQAKKRGKNKACFYDEDLEKKLNSSAVIESALIDITHQSQPVIHYQPIFDLKTHFITDVEALIHWPSDITNHYQPDELIAAAEQMGLIEEMSNDAIKRVIKQSSELLREGRPMLGFTLNISPRQLQNDAVSQMIIDLITQYHLAPENVMIEITEVALSKQSKTITKALEKLSKFGCIIALDCFGAGLASISHLVNYPLDTVKLDKSLLSRVNDEQQRKVFHGITLMLKTLGFTVIAEGVESLAQLTLCEDAGVDKVQGYYLAKPSTLEEINPKFSSLI